jgi:antitoxin ChpS
MFAIPKPILEILGLRPNAEVGITVSEGKLIVDPLARPTYSLSELLSQCDLSVPASAEEKSWLDDAPLGREEI